MLMRHSYQMQWKLLVEEGKEKTFLCEMPSPFTLQIECISDTSNHTRTGL